LDGQIAYVKKCEDQMRVLKLEAQKQAGHIEQKDRQIQWLNEQLKKASYHRVTPPPLLLKNEPESSFI
jgi:uncharacterized membrane protein YcaP (DUF421 family)